MPHRVRVISLADLVEEESSGELTRRKDHPRGW